MKRSIKFWL